VQVCSDSPHRLQTDVINLNQIHWPNRNRAIFRGLYFDPAMDEPRIVVGAERLLPAREAGDHVVALRETH